eukprot:8217944-Lingulodinium_polyedra.AAC.1
MRSTALCTILRRPLLLREPDRPGQVKQAPQVGGHLAPVRTGQACVDEQHGPSNTPAHGSKRIA